MKSIVRSLWCRGVARILVFAMAVPLGLAPAAGAQQGVAVMVLPLENKTQTGGDELAQRVTEAVKMAVEGTGRAAVVTVSESSPTVRRAIDQEKKLSAEDLKPPWDVEKARRVGRELGANVALLGSVDEYVFDESAKRVTITLNVQRIDVSSEERPVLIGVTGHSAEKARPLAKEGPLMTEALDDAALKVAQAVVGGGVIAKPGPRGEPSRKRDRNKLLYALLAVAAVVIIASGGGGGPSGPSRVTSPISDALASAGASDVTLSWAVTGTTAPEGFNIYRAPAGAATLGGEDVIFRAARRARQAVAGPYEKISNVVGTARSVNDATASLGQLYAYQIRAVIKSKESTPVDFKNRYEAPTDTIVVGPGVPIAPRGVSITRGPGSLAATVQWARNPEPWLAGYRVYRGNDPSTLYLLGEFDKNTSRHDDFRNLQANATYYYVVSAVGSDVGARPIETSTAPMPFRISPGPLTPPSNLQAAAGQDTVVLTWTPSPDQAVLGYNLYRNGTKIQTVAGRLTSTYTDTGLQASTTYSYFLRSFDLNGAESGNSNTAAATTTSPPSVVQCSAQPSTILANGADKSTISALVKDSAQHPIAGATVVFERIAGQGTLEVVAGSGGRVVGSTIEAPTDSSGTARAALKAPTSSGSTQVRATVEGTTINCTANVNIVAPTAASIDVTATPRDVIADGTSKSRITATVKDVSAVGIAGVSVHFTISNTSLGVLSASDVTTDSQGRAQVDVTSAAPNAIGPVQVTATAAGKSGSVTLNFIAQPSLTVSVNPTTIPAGGIGSTALITATVKKSDGTPLQGQVVHFAFDLAGAPTQSTTGATIAPEHSNSDGAGLAFSTLTSPPNLNSGNADVILAWLDTNGSTRFEAADDRWGIVGITYTESPASVTVSADPTSVPADSTSTSKITADVRTAIPNPIGPGNKPVADGTRVTFSTTSGVFTSTGTSSATGTTVNGLASVFLRSSDTAETVTVSATSASVSGSTQIQFTPVAARILTVSADPSSISANGTATSTITAYLRQNDGTPIDAETITFSTTLGTLSRTQADTGANGRATTVLTAGRQAGTASVSASAGDLQATVQVTLTGGAPARIDIAQVVPWIIAATGGLPSDSGAPVTTTAHARVTDEFGNPVQDGTQVLFHTDIGQITASVPTTNGAAQATLVSSTFETATNGATFRPGVASVNAWAGSLAGPTAGPIHPIFAGDLDTLTLSGAENSTNLQSGWGADWRTNATGGFGSAPSLSPSAGASIGMELILRDANDNPLPLGIPISWSVQYGDQSASGTTNTFHLNGETRATFSFTPTVLNTTPVSRILATITAGTPGVSSTLNVFLTVRQWIGAAAPASMNPPPQSPTCLVNDTCSCGLTATFQDIEDQYGNLVQDGTPVTFSWNNSVNMAEIDLIPSQSSTIGGRASVLVIGKTARSEAGRCLSGNLTVVATAGEATASVTVNFNAPP